MRALDLLCKLCDSGELFRPLGEFLHVEAESVKQYACQLFRETGRRLAFSLGRLLRPMFQAYTISIPIRRLSDLSVGQITEGFPYLSRAVYRTLDVGEGEVESPVPDWII
jgi:hypothetical protein